MVFRMLLEKLRYEMSNISTAKELLLSNRKNIQLHTEILKMKYKLLKKEKHRNKCNKVLKDVDDSSSSSHSSIPTTKKSISSVKQSFKNNIATMEKEKPNESPKNIPTKPAESKIELNNVEPIHSSIDINCNDSATELGVLDPQSYIILVPADKKSNEESKNKKVFVNQIFDLDIQEYFELVSEDPFELLPLYREVPIKYEHLEALKPYVLKWAANGSDKLPSISLKKGKVAVSKKGQNNTQQSTFEVIDLTDGGAENECPVSSKRKSDVNDENCAKKPREDTNGSILKTYLTTEMPMTNKSQEAIVNNVNTKFSNEEDIIEIS